VSNLDFGETFLEAAGLSIPSDMQGRSLVSVLDGSTPADWRKAFYYHYYEYPRPHHVHPHYGVVTDQYKLIHFYDDETKYWELFDRKTDPHELKSVYGAPEYAAVQKQLESDLAQLRTELKVPEQDPAWFHGGPREGVTPAGKAPGKRAAGKKK
jgi:arylsulfatase A-like enzyme